MYPIVMETIYHHGPTVTRWGKNEASPHTSKLAMWQAHGKLKLVDSTISIISGKYGRVRNIGPMTAKMDCQPNCQHRLQTIHCARPS